MQFRHEIKHEINSLDMLILRQRLSAVMQRDPHVIGGKYEIRSLYFDNADDKALREKIDGAVIREKYRIRMYNRDLSVIHLERKFKYGELGYKDSANLTAEQVKKILSGDIECLRDSGNDVMIGFYCRLRNEGLKPKVIVDYTREPFIFGPGNVRVTMDYNIRTGLNCVDFWDPDRVTIASKESPAILEVKWDNFLPDIIRDAVQLENRKASAFSKFAACRMYG